MRTKNMTADRLETLLNHGCRSHGALRPDSDIRDIEKPPQPQPIPPPALAIDIFYRTIAKTIAGYATVLGGLDVLIFTGGIGEHSAKTRQEVCRRLNFMGIQPGELRPARLRARPQHDHRRNCRSPAIPGASSTQPTHPNEFGVPDGIRTRVLALKGGNGPFGALCTTSQE